MGQDWRLRELIEKLTEIEREYGDIDALVRNYSFDSVLAITEVVVREGRAFPKRVEICIGEDDDDDEDE